jgi:structural maintenance of chromosome 4
LEKISELVEQLNEERNEKLNRVKIVEREKDDLEGPMKEAVAYVKVENEMTKTKNVVCQKYMYVKEFRIMRENQKVMAKNI